MKAEAAGEHVHHAQDERAAQRRAGPGPAQPREPPVDDGREQRDVDRPRDPDLVAELEERAP